MTSDLCMMKTEARGIIYRPSCDNNKDCRVGCRHPKCGCSSVCIDHICRCPDIIPSTHTDTVKPPHLAPPPHNHPYYPKPSHRHPRHHQPPPPPPPHHASSN
ncbi:hypothetical protein V8G54_026331 [Vigna mungo]|uniref:Uncharacterized protein n=1 Tax=Vigna mungo TaxID=3915 RepID=A0AAQ3N0E2_VIGMU